jgi:UDP-N-acetylglucosamine transferase subunit ALG13
VPLIEKFLLAGFKVVIGAEGDQKILLQELFPTLQFVELKGYRIQYGSTKWKTIFKIIFQIPKILTAINTEKSWLAEFITRQPLDVVVSDNRFGLYNSGVHCIFITHQLRIQTSWGSWADSIVQQLNYRFINRFDACWVPDKPGAQSLAGALSQPALLPATPVSYCGVLSAIKKQPVPVAHHLLVLLSGPEPQRTILEAILLQQLHQFPHPVIFIRGLPSTRQVIPVPPHITVHNYLSGKALQLAINAADTIISRSGYSSVMDIVPLQKKYIVIPTPGQAEQEYIAHWLQAQGYAVTASQDHFSLPLLMEQAAALPQQKKYPSNDQDMLQGLIENLITDTHTKHSKPTLAGSHP